jgi:hypothetical protein
MNKLGEYADQYAKFLVKYAQEARPQEMPDELFLLQQRINGLTLKPNAFSEEGYALHRTKHVEPAQKQTIKPEKAQDELSLIQEKINGLTLNSKPFSEEGYALHITTAVKKGEDGNVVVKIHATSRFGLPKN